MFHNFYQDLSKADKKIIQELIQKGLQKEFETGLTAVESTLQKWRRDKTHNGDTCRALYKQIEDFDKYIARRYDGLGGSKYVPTVGMQLRDGLLTEEDIARLSEDAKALVKKFAELL
jgi:hypothetical protein